MAFITPLFLRDTSTAVSLSSTSSACLSYSSRSATSCTFLASSTRFQSSFLSQSEIQRCSTGHSHCNVQVPAFHAPVSMALKKVVVAGGTGHLGTVLVQQLKKAGCEQIIILTRGSNRVDKNVTYVSWNPTSGDGASSSSWISYLENADAVINLCGESIVTRWSEATKKALVDSRILTTRALTTAITSMDPSTQPRCFVGWSAIGYYPTHETEDSCSPLNESSPAGVSFLSRLCQDWEAETHTLTPCGVRTVIVRCGIILGRRGGLIKKTKPVFMLYAGGPVGSGKQLVPWIVDQDLAELVIRAIQTSSMSGVYNGVAPNPVTMNTLCQELANELKRPSAFPVPGFVIKLIFGEGAQVLLEGNRALPTRALEDGFKFKYETIQQAMKGIFTRD